MSGRELDADGTDSYHEDHPWEQAGHRFYIDPSQRTRMNWPPVPYQKPHGPAEAHRWASLPATQSPVTMSLRVVPISLEEARAFVAEHHRHHAPPIGHKFSLGVAEGEQLVGVAIVGRPVSRVIQSEGSTLEVIRSATDGTRNANSMLYGACCKATFALGYDRLITYTQEGESGASLRAAGFRVLAERPARRGWDTPSRARSTKGSDGVARTLWESAALSPTGSSAVKPESPDLGTTEPKAKD